MMKKFLAALLLLPLAPLHAQQTTDDLLEADQAFHLTTRVVDDATLEARWKIAPGYYLYRDKFKFEALDGATLKEPVFPRGKKKQDPLFGVVETYTKAVKVRLPFARQENAPTARLRITAQGCNEPVGVCYPPIIKEVDFKLPPAKTTPAKTASVAKPVGEIQSLADLTRAVAPAGGEVEPVDPEKAFLVNVATRGNDALVTHVDIADCCYLYRDKTKFELTSADGGALPADVRLGSYNLPAGKIKTDEFIGKTEIYEKDFDVTLPVTGLGTQDRDLLLKVTYQGCSQKGVTICYPPATKSIGVRFRNGALSVMATGPDLPVSAPAPGGEPRDFRQLMIAVLAAFGTGLLLTFTPCVLPMIPILSSIIVGQGGVKLTKLRGGLLSAVYVLGTAVTYTIAGVVAGKSGEQLQAYFQNAWAIGIFSALFVLLALSMFGFYELQMPSFIQSRLQSRTHNVKGGSFLGVFIMGLVSALIVGACVSPLLISALGVAIASRDPLLGGAIMFSMSLGMGAILIAIGVGAGFLLPRAGVWMDRVKQVFGVLLLAVAISFLGLLPPVPVLFLWAALFIISAIYLGATQNLPEDARGWRYLWKGIGTFLLIWGVLALLGGFAGHRDILNPLPLSALSSGTMTNTSDARPTAAEGPLFVRVHALSDLENRLAAAKIAGQPVILDYYATWCTDCLRMEKATFADPRVRAAMHPRFVLLQADVSDPNDPESQAIKGRFGVYGPPAMLFFGANGEEHRELRTYGFRNADEFIALLRKI